MNEIMSIPQNAIALGINNETWSALKNSIYPGASDDSVVMAISYCKARELDPLMKPVHLVPMSVKDSKTGKYEYRDVVMPGIGLYRIQAERSGNYAGAKEPEFGSDVNSQLGGVEVTYPSWCKYTVFKRMQTGEIVEFSAKEYWTENYATAGKDSQAPNAMWKKRPYAQLAKCAEAQALRKAWPEIGQQPTAEEMEGKDVENIEKNITARVVATTALPEYPQAKFEENLSHWITIINAGRKTPAEILTMVNTKYKLTEQQIEIINNLERNHETIEFNTR